MVYNNVDNNVDVGVDPNDQLDKQLQITFSQNSLNFSFSASTKQLMKMTKNIYTTLSLAFEDITFHVWLSEG